MAVSFCLNLKLESIVKINITIEITPEELRETIGLPNPSGVQRALMRRMSENVEEGRIDPQAIIDLLQPSMKAGQQILETMLKNMNTMMESASHESSDSQS